MWFVYSLPAATNFKSLIKEQRLCSRDPAYTLNCVSGSDMPLILNVLMDLELNWYAIASNAFTAQSTSSG